jgi:NADH-quinone oxidoreductase subunit F
LEKVRPLKQRPHPLLIFNPTECPLCLLSNTGDVLDGITRGQGKIEDMDMLYHLARDMKDGSLCNLGKTAPNPVQTTLRYFLSEYEAHILDKKLT